MTAAVAACMQVTDALYGHNILMAAVLGMLGALVLAHIGLHIWISRRK